MSIRPLGGTTQRPVVFIIETYCDGET